MFRIERVHDQRAVDFHGLRVTFGVEEQTASEPADAGLAWLMEYCVGPERDDPHGQLGFILILPREPRRVEIERRAAWARQTGQGREQGQPEAGERMRGGHRGTSFLGAGGGCGPYRGKGWPLAARGGAKGSPGVGIVGAVGSPRGLRVG